MGWKTFVPIISFFFRELIQLAVSVKRYISSPENGLEMVMISLVLWILTQNTEENVSHRLIVGLL